jgi:hypothetical protein
MTENISNISRKILLQRFAPASVMVNEDGDYYILRAELENI